MDKKQAALMHLFNVTQSTISNWRTCRKMVPWEKLKYLVEKEQITWDWLLEGREPKYRQPPSI